MVGAILLALFSVLVLFFPPQLFDHVHRQTKIDLSFGEMIEFRMVQPFFSSRDGLAGIELAVKNPHGRKFSIQIVDDDGTVVRELTGLQKKWNGFEVFRFKPIPDSKKKTYTLRVMVEEAGRKIEFFGAKENGQPDTTLKINSVDTNSQLFYRPLYHVGFMELAKILKHRIGMAKPVLFGFPFMFILHVFLFGGIGFLIGIPFWKE